MEPHPANPQSFPRRSKPGRKGANGTRPGCEPPSPAMVAELPRADGTAAGGAPRAQTPSEIRRRRWMAGLIMGISMLIAMLLLLYAGYWLYHQKKPPFSSLRPALSTPRGPLNPHPRSV